MILKEDKDIHTKINNFLDSITCIACSDLLSDKLTIDNIDAVVLSCTGLRSLFCPNSNCKNPTVVTWQNSPVSNYHKISIKLLMSDLELKYNIQCQPKIKYIDEMTDFERKSSIKIYLKYGLLYEKLDDKHNMLDNLYDYKELYNKYLKLLVLA